MAIMFKEVSTDDLSFNINEKKITFIVGESGSGKSSLLSLINGDISYSGEIVKGIGFLKQNPENYFFCNTIYDEILYELKKKKIRCDYDKKIVSALKMVGLDRSFLNRSPFGISKGEQK